MAYSEFSDKRLLEELRRKKEEAALQAPKLNQLRPTGGQTTKINPMDTFDESGNRIELSRTSPLSRFLDRNKRRAETRANIADPNKAFSADIPDDTVTVKPTTVPTNSTPSLQELNTVNTRPDRLPGAPIKLTNNGITGDIESFKRGFQEDRRRQFPLDDINKQNPDGSFSTGNLDVTFAPGTDPAAARRFLAPQGRGATFEERGFAKPTTNNQAPRLSSLPIIQPRRTLFTRKNSNMGWQSRLALNKQILANEAGLAEQELKNKGYLATQGLTNEGDLAEQRLRNEVTMAGQDAAQNKAKAKNMQAIKDRNTKRLKAKYDALKDQKEMMLGNPDYESNLAQARDAYLRSMETGTTGEEDSLAKKYLQ